MRPRTVIVAIVAPALVAGVAASVHAASTHASPARAAAARSALDLTPGFDKTVRPFVMRYCAGCHGGSEPKAEMDLSTYKTVDAVTRDHERWTLVLQRLQAKEMPPEDADVHPSDAARAQVMAWIEAWRREEARKNAADPGIVLARRLSNSEYNYTIRDLTGVDLRPAREFPVDPANPAGFDNSGESLAMSPALMGKYLRAAREVADHMVLKPEGLAFAPHPMLAETDRDRYCVQQILDFYRRQDTDLGDYFLAAWRFKHRAAFGKPRATLAQVAAERGVSAKYLGTLWRALETTPEDVGPLARLQAMWKELPVPVAAARIDDEPARAGCERMRGFVVQVRKKTGFKYAPLSGKGLRADGQPYLMWRNRQYATHRTSFDPSWLQVEGETPDVASAAPARIAAANEGADEEAAAKAQPAPVSAADPDLHVPAGERARYEAAFARFCAIFPDAFYVSERGRYFPDDTRDKGRYLSAGFHNLMGYFRDDLPLYELVLDEKGRKELDALWREMDFIASTTARTYVQFYLSESGEAKPKDAGASALLSDQEIVAEPTMAEVVGKQLAKAEATGNETALAAVREHFAAVKAAIRWTERARAEAEPRQLDALLDFASRAYRRPLTPAERADLLAFYRSRREASGLDHEDAVRDVMVSVLMSPDFCYRIDLVPPTGGVHALDDYALASRLSYFLWSSLPDAELLAHAAAGDLHRPEVLVRQAGRMLKDARIRGLATEFGGSWLDFRRFEEHNAVDRERFKTFDNDLRQAMFEEPIRFLLDVVQQDRPVLDFLYANRTFVNAPLARHYGMPAVEGGPDRWVRVDDADRYGRGGLLPMAVFLTKNAPGLRTSPVKRGYWVVKQVLGEVIPPPPAVVPELARDEAKLDLPVRDALARHRQDKTCAACHARFDAYGLVFEGYGPVGERRTQDLAGRAVDDSATFPGGGGGAGLAGLRAQIHERRQDDFVNNLARKLLAYALNRSLTVADDAAVQPMAAKLAKDGYRFGSLVESIVVSPQFLTKRSVSGATVADAGAGAGSASR
jgi:hypothetical protein